MTKTAAIARALGALALLCPLATHAQTPGALSLLVTRPGTGQITVGVLDALLASKLDADAPVALQSDLAAETAARSTGVAGAISAAQAALAAEVLTRQAGDNASTSALQAAQVALAAEVLARQSGDAASVSAAQASLATEAQARAAADALALPLATLGAPGGPAALDALGNASALPTVATATTTPRTLAARAADLVNVRDGYGGVAGAKGDGQLGTYALTLPAGSATLTSATPIFAAGDVGKVAIVAGAGVAPTAGLVATIPVASPGSGYAAVPACAVTDGAGTGSGATCVALMSLQSATVATPGAGCLAGATNDMVVGIDAAGTPARIGVTTAADGTVSGVSRVIAPGLVSALGNIATAPAYGANCSTPPTFALSYGIAAAQVTALGTAYSTGQTTATLSGGTPVAAGALGMPRIGAPVPPLVTTIAAYVSPTQVTLAAPASTAISGSDKLLWASDDQAAFRAALAVGRGLWVPAGLYWIGGTLDPGLATTIRGEGMAATTLAYDAGTTLTQDSQVPGAWVPLLKNVSLSAGVDNGKGTVQIEDLQIRGLLDFGRVNVGAAALELNNYGGLDIERVKFFQIPWMAMQPESIRQYAVIDSVFEYVMRDQARCRSCFAARIIGDQFLHSDDDSVALHQASYVQGPGLVHETTIVEGNDFQDTTGVHVLGARTLIVRGNTFRRMKLQAIAVNADANEGIEQQHAITIADNQILDMVSRIPIQPGSAGISVVVAPPSVPAGVTGLVPGGNMLGTVYFPKPWDYRDGSVIGGTAFAPAARGVDIHDNTVMRTLPAVANYSAWGQGSMLSIVGPIDPVMPDSAAKPTAAITASINIAGLDIHHNDVANARRGIVVQDNTVSPGQTSLSITFNHVFDTWEYGIVEIGTGIKGNSNIIGNDVDVDPYNVSPGRSGNHGGWSNAYALSKCYSTNYNGPTTLALNTFADCYTVQTAASWVINHNTLRGTVFSGTTGQPGYSSSNYGIGSYPPIVAEQFYIAAITADPSASPFATYGALAYGHPTSGAVAPTSGFHSVGDFVWSSAPGACSCQGWLVLTTGTAWTPGTDFKMVPLQ